MGPGEGVGDSGAEVGAAPGWSGRRWLSRLEAGTPLNLHRAAATGQSCLASQGRS